MNALGASFLLLSLCSANSLTLEDISPHFPTSTEIIWKAPTNDLRKQFWVYRKSPELFSQVMLSNAIVLASLQEKGFPNPSVDGVQWDLDKWPFGHPLTFAVIPKDGQICYSSPTFRYGSAENLPSYELVAKGAWECALRLGIDPKQLTQKNLTTNYCEYDSNGKLARNTLCGRGIVLARRIDGVDFRGEDEGFTIEFGSHGKIRSFCLTWPKLSPDQKRETASASQIIDCIRRFKTPLLYENQPDYLKEVKTLSKATKLIITKITPFYGEGLYGEDPEDGRSEPFPFVTPFAELKVVAELNSTNVTATLVSPILVSEVDRVLKKADTKKIH